MKLDILNINKFIQINKLQEVSNPVALTSNKMPSPNGIFSYEIFGYTTEDRKNNFAYIDLHGNFLHPQCVRVLGRMGSLSKILNREKWAIVVDRKVKLVDSETEGAETGLDFYYNNWENIKWIDLSVTSSDSEEEELSIDKKNRLKFLEYLKKDEAFVNKWIVLPPYYRDFNSNDITMGDDINKVYNDLISRTATLKTSFGHSTFGYVTAARIQTLLGLLYDITLGPVSGKAVNIKTGEMSGNAKRSMIKKNLLGRALDFSATSVITAPIASDTASVDDTIHFGETRLPLQTIMAMAKPFFLNYCQGFIEDYVAIVRADFGSSIKKIDNRQWSVSELDKIITRFIKSDSEKNLPIKIEYINNDNIKHNVYFAMREYVSEQDAKQKKYENSTKRYMTWLDLFYMAAVEICKDKYSLNTRHPVANNQNIYASKVEVLSTNKTRPIWLSLPVHLGTAKEDYIHYPYYPYIDCSVPPNVNKNPKPSLYYDLYRVTIIGNSVIKSLGADYDGDMLQFRMLFTKEANDEAKKLIWKKTNFFDANGSLSRGLSKIGKDCSISLYSLTKD